MSEKLCRNLTQFLLTKGRSWKGRHCANQVQEVPQQKSDLDRSKVSNLQISITK